MKDDVIHRTFPFPRSAWTGCGHDQRRCFQESSSELPTSGKESNVAFSTIHQTLCTRTVTTTTISSVICAFSGFRQFNDSVVIHLRDDRSPCAQSTTIKGTRTSTYTRLTANPAIS